MKGTWLLVARRRMILGAVIASSMVLLYCVLSYVVLKREMNPFAFEGRLYRCVLMSVCPPGILLFATAGADIGEIVKITAVCIVLNAVLYGIVGILVWLIAEKWPASRWVFWGLVGTWIACVVRFLW